LGNLEKLRRKPRREPRRAFFMRHSRVSSSKHSKFLVVVSQRKGAVPVAIPVISLLRPVIPAGFPAFPQSFGGLSCFRPDKTGENEQKFQLPAEVEMAASA
jgi:hypothetical protein